MNADPSLRTDIQGVLAQMRVMQAQAQAQDVAALRTELAAPAVASETAGASFSETLTDAVQTVNELQMDADRQSTAFVRGETDNLVGVMIAMQKADVGFQAVTQIRNRMVSAYQEIMKMPI